MHHGDQSGLEPEMSSSTSWRNPTGSGSINAATTDGHPGTTSSSRGATSTLHESTLQSDQSSESKHVNIIKRLEKEIESFQNNQSSKTSTITSILGILEENSNVEITQPQKDSTFDSYLTEILAIESARDCLQETGSPNDSPPTGSANQSAKQVGTNITPEPIENQMNPTQTVRATSQPKNPNSSNQICHGTMMNRGALCAPKDAFSLIFAFTNL